MKQVDKAESNEEANRMNDRAVAPKVTNSKFDLRIVQPDCSTKSLLEDMKSRPESGTSPQAEQDLDSQWLRKPSDFRPTTRCQIPSNEDQIKAISATGRRPALTDSFPNTSWETPRTARTIERAPVLPSIGEGDQMQGGTLPQITRVGEKKLRLPRALGPQPARAHAALLPPREKGHRSRRL
jgi:hypothetical protein